MKRMIARIMRYYGAPVTLEGAADAAPVRAFLRPVTSKSWQSMRAAIDALGQIPQGQYLFLGPADCMLDTVQSVCADGKRYVVRRTQRLLIGEEAVCWWALLELGGPDDAGAD